MKKSTFLFLKLFVIASVLTILPYTHMVLLTVKDKAIQTIPDWLLGTDSLFTAVQ